MEHIDRQPEVERCTASKGEVERILDPTKKCNDRFYIENSETLVIRHTDQKFQAGDFCVEFNGDAKTKDDHFAKICVTDQKESSKFT